MEQIIGSKNIPKEPKIEYTKRGLKFEANGDGTCKLVGTGLFLEEDIAIPPLHEGMPVTKIGDEAFKKCKKNKDRHPSENRVEYWLESVLLLPRIEEHYDSEQRNGYWKFRILELH